MSDDQGLRWHGMRVVARGANRICVLHPEMPGDCLKYELRPVPGMRRYWRRRLRHSLAGALPRLGLNAAELTAWRRLHARLGAALEEHVAPCIGIVQTDAGPALRSRLVADADGQPAPTIAMLLERGPTALDADTVVQALDRFEAWLIAHRIPLSDLNAGNLALVEGVGPTRLVCVDLKSAHSGRELVPLSRWSWTLMRKKIARRCQRLRSRIDAIAGQAALADPPGLP